MSRTKDIIVDGLILFTISSVLVMGIDKVKHLLDVKKNDLEQIFRLISDQKISPSSDLSNLEKKILAGENATFLKQKDPLGRTALMWACYANYATPGPELLKDKKYVSTQVLRCEASMLPVVDLLIQKGVPLEGKDNDEWTAQMWASWSDYANIVNHLLEKGSSLNAVDRRGNSSLIIASQKGNIEVVKVLLKHGADKTLKRHDGLTASEIVLKKLNRGLGDLAKYQTGNVFDVEKIPYDYKRLAMVANALNNSDLAKKTSVDS